jgi:multidrug resistance efflux pump
MKRRRLLLSCVGAAALVAAAVYILATRPGHELILTGIVTTDEVIVSPEIQGRLQRVLVRQGDMVTNGQLIAAKAKPSRRTWPFIRAARNSRLLKWRKRKQT